MGKDFVLPAHGVGLPGGPAGSTSYDGDNRNFKHSQHYWTLKPGSSGLSSAMREAAQLAGV